jgi:hypothetical protein
MIAAEGRPDTSASDSDSRLERQKNNSRDSGDGRTNLLLKEKASEKFGGWIDIHETSHLSCCNKNGGISLNSLFNSFKSYHL